jgi:hypothetical protein
LSRLAPELFPSSLELGSSSLLINRLNRCRKQEEEEDIVKSREEVVEGGRPVEGGSPGKRIFNIMMELMNIDIIIIPEKLFFS